MKKFILIGFAIFLATVPGVHAQQTNSPAGQSMKHALTATNVSSSVPGASTNAPLAYKQSKADLKIQRKLAGTWVTTWETNLTVTDIIATNGNFVSQTTGFARGLVGRYQGTFLVKDGMVIGQAKFGPQTVTMHLHLIRLDNHELVWSNDTGGKVTTFHKVEK